MAQKKDFSGINTERVYGALEQATAANGQQPTISPQEAKQRATEMRTQGRAGAKAARINMAFSKPNYEYLKVVSQGAGLTLTALVNLIIERYRTDPEHAEAYKKAQEIRELL